MTPKEFHDKQLYISIGAGTNQRIYQHKASWWTGCDRACKIVVATLAVSSLCLSIWSVTPQGASWITTSIVVSGMGALSAIALNVLPFGDWASRHNALHQRWSDLREDVDSMVFAVKGDPTQAQIAHLKDLDAKYHRICASEPKCRDALIKHYYAEEKQSRQKVALC